MALVRTTLSSACSATDTSIVVASATGFAANYVVLIDQEQMQVTSTYVSGTTIPVLRGQGGTKTAAHVVTAGVVAGVATDWSDSATQTAVNYPVAGRAVELRSITATSSLTLPTPGSDLRVVLNGTSVIALTIPVPTVDMDGTKLTIVSNGAAAHTLTFTGGLSGAGSNYDVITVNATAPAAFEFIAANELWMMLCQAPMGGTVTNIIGSIA